MHISHITIRNFRALADINCDLGPRINVIVGPNAVGKTTVLQAVRLTKAILAPRTQSEAQQVLISLGAASPHFPQRLFLNSLARDVNVPIEVRCTYTLDEAEIALLRTSIAELVQSIVAGRVGQNFSNPAAIIQFLQSPQGQQATIAATQEVSAALTRIEREKTVLLGLTLHGLSGQLNATDPLAGSLIAFLDQRLPPSKSIFSYFPADRALPMGEVNLQLGGPDAQQQLESHNSQPQLKYTRLKNLIINSLVIDESERQTVHAEFEKIFSELLRGRRIKTINVNDLGLLSVMTEELSSGRLIELDSLSSGEKNIALTFLIVGRSVSDGGIALFDEPELHLNPAVSRDVLSFMMTQYAKPRNIQFIMCTHSPEILTGAFSDDECNLLHLKSSSDISRVGKRALDEYADALQRLGTSVTEGLLYEGAFLVEGVNDVAFLETGFPDISKRYKIKELGGRSSVEKSISELQALEKRGQKVSPIYVIFDRDNKPSGLNDSAAVKILQWPRYCLENYMIDLDVIASIMRDSSATGSPIQSEGEVHRMLRDLAFKQLDALVAREVYAGFGFENASATKDELKHSEIDQLTDALFERLARAKASIPELHRDQWISDFKRRAAERKAALMPTWEANWREVCDGKKLLADFYKAGKFKMSEAALKGQITQRMRDTQSETWMVVKGLLENLIQRPNA
jgi:predicted ATPase